MATTVTRGLLGVVVAGALLPVAAVRAADGDAVAMVNGRPISKARLVDTLVESHGLQILQQLIVLELAKAETRRMKIRVTAGDVDFEFERALRSIAPEVDQAGQALSEAEKRQVLDRLLVEKGLSFAEFMIGMERNAHLRKIVERGVAVDEGTLREEFARLYGEKVEVRAVMVSDINGLHEALNLLEQGTVFEQVARQVSEHAESASRGGVLPPFAFNDEAVAAVLREAAFALEPGGRSKPIKVGRWWWILQLVRRIPPTSVRFADVREEVERSLRARVVPQEMNKLVTQLFQQADIRVLDRTLKPKFEQLLEENRVMEGMQR
jgi:foldase protein PrsA